MATIKRPNAYIQYWDSDAALYHRRYLWVMEIEQAHELAGSTAQSKLFQHFYSKSYTPGAMKVGGRVPTQDHYDMLTQFYRAWQMIIMASAGGSNLLDPSHPEYTLPLMRLVIPSEDISYDGLIMGFVGGRKRFNIAPPFTFNFEVIQDNHSIAITQPTKAIANFFFNGPEILKGETQLDSSAPASDPITGADNTFDVDDTFHHRDR